MHTKFNSVPVDNNTKIISQSQSEIDKYNVLHQKWNWDGIIAESIVFDNQDITKLSEDDIKAVVIASSFYDYSSSITIKTSDEFTFVNFNFKT